MNRDLGVGGALSLISLGYAALALTLPTHPAPGPGPAFLPLLIACSLFVVGIAFVRDGWKVARDRRDAQSSSTGDHQLSLSVILICVAYVPAFWLTGFLASTAALTILLAWVFGERRWWILTTLGLAVPLLLLALFGVGLGVRFPLLPSAF